MSNIAVYAAVLVISIALSVAAWKIKMLTADGSLTAAVVLCLIGIFGDFYWLVMLTVFAVIGFAVTKISFSKKKSQGLQEGKHGERTWKNVLGVSFAPAVVAVANFAVPGYHSVFTIAFLGAVSTAAADTVGSELGVKDGKVWLITSFKRVKPGTDGGVSMSGTLLSFAAAFAIAFLGWVLFFRDLDILFVIPGFAGFAGCIMDSVLGATLESRKLISKYTNNNITELFGAVIAGLAYYIAIF